MSVFVWAELYTGLNQGYIHPNGYGCLYIGKIHHKIVDTTKLTEPLHFSQKRFSPFCAS